MSTKSVLAILCVVLLIAPTPYSFAQQQQPMNQPAPAGRSQGQPQQILSPDQLDSLVAPLALYPDPILSQVLVASTYPLEIAEGTMARSELFAPWKGTRRRGGKAALGRQRAGAGHVPRSAQTP